MTPYLTQHRPPAFVAALPPIVDDEALDGVGRVPQVVCGGRRAQIVVHHTGLDDRQPLPGVDLDDGAHLLGAQNHAPVDGVRAPGDSGAGAAGDDRDAVRRAHAHDTRHLRRAAWPHDRERSAVLGQVGLVVPSPPVNEPPRP